MGKQKFRTSDDAAGFSLMELIIAMTITIAITGIAGTLLAGAFKVRTREHARTDAMADVQRSINIMSREIAIGGFGFDNVSNGLVVGDSSTTTIRVLSNLNRYGSGATKYTIADPGEDIKYQLDAAPTTNYLVRFDRFAPVETATTVLANRIDTLSFTYLDAANNTLNVTADPSQVANAAMVRITVGVNLPAVGKPGSSGYQPASTVQLTSDVTLRNKKENLDTY